MPVGFKLGVYTSASILSVLFVYWNYWKLEWRNECEAKNRTLRRLKVVKQATEKTEEMRCVRKRALAFCDGRYDMCNFVA